MAPDKENSFFSEFKPEATPAEDNFSGGEVFMAPELPINQDASQQEHIYDEVSTFALAPVVPNPINPAPSTVDLVEIYRRLDQMADQGLSPHQLVDSLNSLRKVA